MAHLEQVRKESPEKKKSGACTLSVACVVARVNPRNSPKNNPRNHSMSLHFAFLFTYAGYCCKWPFVLYVC